MLCHDAGTEAIDFYVLTCLILFKNFLTPITFFVFISVFIFQAFSQKLETLLGISIWEESKFTN